MDDRRSDAAAQEGRALAQTLQQRLDLFLLPVLSVLDAQIDRRLVRTLAGTVRALLCWRNRAHGLLLSELGAYLLSPAQAPAGTKRLSNLLRSPKWVAATLERQLWRQADAALGAYEARGEAVYVAWDESVVEKPESRAAEGLCPVRPGQGRALDGAQTRVSAAPGAAGLRARPPLARPAPAGPQRPADPGHHALVDHARGAG
jgi:hypothetical protein